MGSIFRLNLTALIVMQRPVPEILSHLIDNFLLEAIGVKFKWHFALEPQPTLTCRETLLNLHVTFTLHRAYIYLKDVIRTCSNLAIVSDCKWTNNHLDENKWTESQFIIYIGLLVFLGAESCMPSILSHPCSISVLFQDSLFHVLHISQDLALKFPINEYWNRMNYLLDI